nr:reverse transcriptase domain-containing protein [Tanacetum cinerariifolium]
MPLENEILQVEEQPLPTADSPTADLPRYIPESNPQEDLEEDDEDPKEDPVDYPIDRDDDDDDEEEESFGDEADDVEEDEDEDDDDEEEHPAPANSILPPPVHRTTARISILVHEPTPIPSPPLPVSPPLPISSPPLPASPTYPLRYRAAMIRLRAETPSTSHPLSLSTPPSGTPPLLPIPLLTPSLLMLLPSTIDPSYKVDESSSATAARPTGGFRADYGFMATLDDEIRHNPEREDKDEIYERLDDAQDNRALISERVNMLYRERRDHARTARLKETEARLARQAWVQSMDTSDTTRAEHVMLTEAKIAKTVMTLEWVRGDKLLVLWFERMETVFRISSYTVENQIKFATCTLFGSALTWWNSHVRTVGPDVAYAMTWTNLRKNMTDKYCPRGEIKKLEVELWNLKVKGTDV